VLDTSNAPSTSRPRPVVIYGAFVAALGAFLGYAGLADLMPKTVIAWVALVGAVVTAGGGFLVQGLTTPLSSPKDARGVDLKPVDVADAEKAEAVATAVAEAVVPSPAPVMQWAPGRGPDLPTTTGQPVIPE
jgi:hypothetical protein